MCALRFGFAVDGFVYVFSFVVSIFFGCLIIGAFLVLCLLVLFACVLVRC